MANETLTEPENFAEPVARDPRAAWLPESMTMKIINMHEAIKNYCAAVSDKMYFDYCRVHARTEENGERRIIKWQNPDAVAKLTDRSSVIWGHLYGKYWRLLPMAMGYPKDAPLELGTYTAERAKFQGNAGPRGKIKNGPVTGRTNEKRGKNK